MKLELPHDCPLNLDFTLCCGQTFRWEKRGKWWFGVVKETVVKMRQQEGILEFENVDATFIEDYLRLQDDLPAILRTINKDRQIKTATKSLWGLRILRQDPWECLLSYICATYKNVAAIRQMIFNLSKKFGRKIHFQDFSSYTFPTAEKLSRATIEELNECSLGYRAKYVQQTAKLISKQSFDFERLRRASYLDARRELFDFPGVGPKVADCVLLFSLDKLEAFPVDVWIKRVIQENYANCFSEEFIRKLSNKKSPSESEYEKLSLFGREYFGKYAGYAQEYLFHFERMKSLRAKKVDSEVAS